MDRDKLSRIAALRPAAVPSRTIVPAGGTPRVNAELLAGILGAESHINARGSHLTLRRTFTEPRRCEIGPRALRMLMPEAAGSMKDAGRWLFLDTETTGLAGGTGTYAFLVGIAWWDESGMTIKQLFMRDHSEEPSLLFELSRILAQRPVLVTFNGKSFDWPLLETRFRMTRVAVSAAPDAHLDLLHPARQLWRYRLRSVALSELERHVIGLDRGDDILSETIPGRYFDFLRGGPPEAVAEVFRHNQMDLLGLAALAAHITRLVEEAEHSTCEASELFGLSRLLQRRGEKPLAGQLYKRALAEGIDEAPGRTAKRELALLAKGKGDFAEANRYWQELRGDSLDGLEAYRQLAMYHEHHAGDYEKAARLTRDALVCLREALNAGRISTQQYRRWHSDLQHRLNRLSRKIGDIPSCGSGPVSGGPGLSDD